MDPKQARLLPHLCKAHPWHGVSIGGQAPDVVQAYIEIVPSDSIKYEIDKASGHLRVDRPQKYSNQCPALYGFIPQTYCGNGIGALSAARAKRPGLKGDGDPLDICVLTERLVPHGDLLLKAVPIGGLRMIDKNEADDKIIAVLHEDLIYGGIKEVRDCPANLIDRLRHYFLTYKNLPGQQMHGVEITDVYSAADAKQVIEQAQHDYVESYSEIYALYQSVFQG